MPLSLQALYTGCPKSSSSDNCKNKLLKIVDFLLARETSERRNVDTSKILQAKEMLRTDNKKLIMDATKNAIEHILEKNYQYQAVSSKVLGQSLPTAAARRPIRQRIKYQSGSPVRYRPRPAYVRPRDQIQASYVNTSPAGFDTILSQIAQRQNVNPVIPVTSVSGQINDEDDVLVFYKPRVVTYNQLYGNVVQTFSKRILVPYYVSKLN